MSRKNRTISRLREKRKENNTIAFPNSSVFGEAITSGEIGEQSFDCTVSIFQPMNS